MCARIVQVTVYLCSQTITADSMNVNMPVGDIVSVSGEAAASGDSEANVGSNRNYIGAQLLHSTELELICVGGRRGMMKAVPIICCSHFYLIETGGLVGPARSIGWSR